MNMGPGPEQSIIREETINYSEWRPGFDRNDLELLTERYYLAVERGEVSGERSLVSPETRLHARNLLQISLFQNSEGTENLSAHQNDDNLLDAIYLTLNWRKDTIRALLNTKLGIDLPPTTSTLELITAAELAVDMGCPVQSDIIEFAIIQSRREIMIQKLGLNYMLVRNSTDNKGNIIPEKRDNYETAEMLHNQTLTRTFQDYKDIVLSVKNILIQDREKRLLTLMQQNLSIDFGSESIKTCELALLTFMYVNKLSNGDRSVFESYVHRLGIPKPPIEVQIGNLNYDQTVAAAQYIAKYFSGMNYSHLRD